MCIWRVFEEPSVPRQSKVEAVSVYTSNQAEHHRWFSYREEIRKLLKRHRLAFEEGFLWE